MGGHEQAEAKLARLHQQNELILSSAAEGILGLDLQGNHTFVNPAAARMLGYEPDELLGCPSHAIWHHTKADGSFYPGKECTIHATLCDGETHRSSTEVFWRKDGRSFPVELASTPIRESGRLVGAVVTFLDITERKRAEAAIRQSEERFRILFQQAKDCILQLEIDPGGRPVILDANDAAFRLLGYERDELIGQPVSSIEATPDASEVEVIDARRRNIVSGKETSFSARHRCKDGTIRDFECSVTEMQIGSKTIAVSVERDVTERKRAEAALRRSETRFRMLFEKSSDALMTLAPPAWSFTSGNPATIAMFGVRDEADFVSRGPWQLSPERQPDGRDSAEKAREMIERAMREGSHFFEWTHRRLSGEEFPATVFLTRIDIDGGSFLQANVRDETERMQHEIDLRRAKEEAEAATRAKSEFLANMSHEIRTPMNAVVGLSYLLLKTELPPRPRERVRQLQSSARALLALINNILDFSKMEAGKVEVESIPFGLDQVLSGVSESLAGKCAEKNLEMHFQVGPDVPRALTGDPLRLGQVLLNLAGNAVKFTAKGDVLVSVELASRSETAARLRFAVRDTGPGISPEEQARLFQPFVQADSSTTRQFGGSGLGLAISKQLVGLMGGDLSLASTVGVGTTFTFTVAVGLPEPSSQHPPMLPADLRGMRVLVVDDSPLVRTVLCESLANLAFTVSAASSGPEAIAAVAAAEPPYDLVLLDWQMPVMDGVETARRIKARPGLLRVPKMILLSSFDCEESVRKAAGLELDSFLPKPFTDSLLLDVIMEVFGWDRVSGSRAQLAAVLDERPSPALAGARALLVEDNKLNQLVGRSLLEGFGMTVESAGDGQQAVAMVQADPHRFDAILMDVQMPVMDGYAATRALREQPGMAELPIIAVTANALDAERRRCLEAGMNDYVSKPIDPDRLREVLERWVRRPGPLTLALSPRRGPRGTDPASPLGGDAGAHSATGEGPRQNGPLTLALSPADRGEGTREGGAAKALPASPRRGEAGARSAAKRSEAQRSVGEGFPALMPGVDTEAALRRLMGNRELLVRLLREFAGEHAKDTDHIRASLARGDLDGARAAVHRLKGVAGNLAAQQVFASAAALESALRQGAPAPLGAHLDALESAMKIVTQSVASLTIPASI
jgi:two-component system sensor histidine kinase/response regulator